MLMIANDDTGYEDGDGDYNNNNNAIDSDFNDSEGDNDKSSFYKNQLIFPRLSGSGHYL